MVIEKQFTIQSKSKILSSSPSIFLLLAGEPKTAIEIVIHPLYKKNKTTNQCALLSVDMIFVVGTNVPMKRVSKLFEMLSRQVLAIAYIRKATTTIDYYGTHNRQFGRIKSSGL